MSKNNISLLLMIILGWIALLILPWWADPIIAFVIAYLMIESPIRAFVNGFIAFFTFWTFTAIYMNAGNTVSIATEMGKVLGGIPASAVYILTGIIGGITGGIGALTGTLLRISTSNRPAETP
ncbi:MAG TPA: hypothetical protein PKC30_03365 [Saprospiraceae bacterium]|nr:hypothetical protein [Saprospiraceae bacterium]